MKTVNLIFVMAVLVFTACNKDDEAPAPVGPQISYEQTKFTVPFFTQEHSDVPTLQWNGEVGSLSLSSAVPGIQLNEDNGVLTFKKALPLGQHTVTVIATNAVGQDAVSFEIDNAFQGSFTGGYNNNPASEVVAGNLKLDFADDGAALLTNNGVSAPGTWIEEGDTITAVYSINNGASYVTIEGTVTHNSLAANFRGYYYQGQQVVPGMEKGLIKVQMN